ncbi:MAG: hydroxymethylglutaryl-CoA lyase [Hyphomicrobiales bacterium]
MSDLVTIVEVGPRDGLQNEKNIIPSAQKIKLIEKLASCGIKRIEVTSFVSPKWVPQLADAAEVMSGVDRLEGVSYSVLAPNLKGAQLAVDSKADEIAIFTSASEGFCQRNISCSIRESIDRFKPVIELSKEFDISVRGYVSCITDCPYDGAVESKQVGKVVGSLVELGCREISLGDTIGAATANGVSAVLDVVLDLVPAEKLAGHYHNTNGQALENIKVSLSRGLRVFDSAVAGLGGCPYAPGAQGNVATEDIVRLLHAEGFNTGVDLQRLISKVVPFAQTLKN